MFINKRRSWCAAVIVLAAMIASLSIASAQPNTPVEPYVSNTPLSSLPTVAVGPGKKDNSPPLRQGGRSPLTPAAPHEPDPLWLFNSNTAAVGALGITPDEFGIANPNFPGISGGNPPDTNGSVGPNYYIQMSNSGRAYQIWDKQGTSLARPTNMRQIWIDAGAPANDDCRIGQRGDPYVIYDHLADRFVLTQFANDRGFGAGDPLRIQCIAVAQGPDPVNDGWYAYTFNLRFSNDYPKFGMWPDGYYNVSQRGYFGNAIDVTVFDRATMLNGGAATFQTKNAGNLTIIMLPSELQGPAPPAGSPNYYVHPVDGALFGGNDRIEIREFDVDWGVPANTSFGNLTTLTPSAFSSDICAGNNLFNYCIDQPGVVDKLEALSV